MVQRKLSLQLLHHAETQPSSDAKSPRGADLKAKKMKKSGSFIKPPLRKATPNYMKPTTSSDARKEQSHSSKSSSSSPSPKRVITKKPIFKAARKCSSPALTSVDAKRATCSSTLKDSKFPALLPLNPSGHSAVKVCPYTYCSLNGHRHPPLSSFLSAARQTRVRAPPDNDDFFVEIYMAAREQEERFSEEFSGDSFDGSDMEWETGYGSLLQYAYKTDAVQVKGEGKDCCGFDEVLVDAQESVDEDGGFAFSSTDDDDHDHDHEFESPHHLQISAPTQQVLVQEEEEETKYEENHIFSDSPTKSTDEEADSIDDLNHEFLPNEEAVAVAVAVAVEASDEDECRGEIAEEISALLQFGEKSKRAAQDGDELGDFNPRAPNFLDVEADPEGERVDLRHQDLDERRNSEEWMVDYALRQVVTELGPAKKRKVALLVEAFEKVMPFPTKFDLHLSHASRFDQPRPMQACS